MDTTHITDQTTAENSHLADHLSHSLSHYPTYAEYKDSGVDWLGEIPKYWDLVPAFKFIDENKQKNSGLNEMTVLSLSYGNIIIKSKEKLTGLVPESFETYQILQPDDIVIRCTDLQNDKVSLRTGLVKNHGIITSAYLGLKVSKKYNAKFLHYFLHSLDTSKAIYAMGTGLRQNLSFRDFKRFLIPNISIEEQTAIANFLSQKTAQIDQVIALKQQQIAKLEEYKQILIQNAVTKGLDPNAEMKDSGVDWIGEIPKHWEVNIGMNIFYEVKKINLGLEEKKVLSLSYGRVIVKPKSKMFGLMPENFETYQIVRNGDIIIRGTDLQNDKVSLRTGYVTTTGIISSAYLNLRTYQEYNSEFIQIFLHTIDFNKVLYKFGSGVRQSLSFKDFKRMSVPLPPLDEQTQIADYVQSLNQTTQQGIQTYQTQINRLKEYKTILIHQAVTGKIKVTDFDNDCLNPNN